MEIFHKIVATIPHCNVIIVAAAGLILVVALKIRYRRIASEKNRAIFRLWNEKDLLEKKLETERIKNQVLSEIVDKKLVVSG